MDLESQFGKKNFTDEILVKVYMYHLAKEVALDACEKCKMYQFMSCYM